MAGRASDIGGSAAAAAAVAVAGDDVALGPCWGLATTSVKPTSRAAAVPGAGEDQALISSDSVITAAMSGMAARRACLVACSQGVYGHLTYNLYVHM
jgi:hypothetical protein